VTETTTNKEISTQGALAAAEARYRSTQAAVDAARAAATRQELDGAEVAAAAAIAAAATGEGDRAAANAARERVEQLRRDYEWAQVELGAAEQAMSRAADDAARAHRGVVAQEYLVAHAEHNSATAQVNVLLAQLPALLAELIPLVEARNELHRRLAQEALHFAPDEWPKVPPGQPITAPDVGATPNVMVELPRGAVADGVAAGVAQARVAAAERQRAAARGED
jgi:hypothetical protein